MAENEVKEIEKPAILKTAAEEISENVVLTYDPNDKSWTDADGKPLESLKGPSVEQVHEFEDEEENKEKVIETLEPSTSSKKVEVIEHTIVKEAQNSVVEISISETSVEESSDINAEKMKAEPNQVRIINAEIAAKQLQTLSAGTRGRPKRFAPDAEPTSMEGVNGKTSKEYTISPRNKAPSMIRRTFVTPDELDKELEATMEKIEPRSSTELNTNNGADHKTSTEPIESHDLIAILEGNDMNDIMQPSSEIKPENMQDDGTNAAEAEIALQQMMSLPKQKRGRKPHKQNKASNAKPEPKVPAKQTSASDLVSSIVNDWSDNEDTPSSQVVFEVTATEYKSTPGETTITISPAKKVPVKSGAAKRKQPQGVVEDVPGSGSIEIIQTVEPPRIINKDAPRSASPMKFERRRVIKKKVIWDPDDPSPSFSSRIGNTTIKKVTKLKVEAPETPINVKKSVSAPVKVEPSVVPPKAKGRKRSGKSEIDKLLGDEGAINMIYSLERENKNSDIPEIKTAVDEGELLDVDEEKINLLKKANALKKSVIKQTKSPPSTGIRQGRKKEVVQTATPATPTAPSTSSSPTTTVEPSTTANEASRTPTPTKKATAAKKRKAAGNSESWDYVYSSRRTRDDDSMIVRRRSNSSYSSTTSPRRLSLDQSTQPTEPETSNKSSTKDSQINKNADPEIPEEAPPPKKHKGKGFEFAKPSAKKQASSKPVDTSKLVAQIKGKLKGKPISQTAANKESATPLSPEKKKIIDSKQLSIKKYDKFALLNLPSIDGKLKDCLTLQLLNKMIAALKQLENDPMCNAVVITSAGVDFCRGINYSILIQIDGEKRKNAAREFASAVRKFIFALATFPKPLICGVQGEVCGIGLMILPLFDIVLAKDDVKLSAPYGLIGHFPEGLSVLRLLNKIKTRTTSELFYLNRQITAEEGIEHELVTKVVPKSEFNDEILLTARSVVASCPQALLSIKQNLTKDLIEQIDEALSEEEQLLIRHWISAECQEKFKSYMAKGHW